MAEVIYVPSQHRCLDELDQLGSQPVGTIAKCSCGLLHVRRESQFDGMYWTLDQGRSSLPVGQ